MLNHTCKSQLVYSVNVTMLVLVYEQAAMEHPWCDVVFLTDVMADFDCDTFFPEFDRELFKEQER